jgi:hypothetical protein
MRPGCTVQVDRLSVGKRNIESPDCLLPGFEGNVPAVDYTRLRSLEGLAGRVLCTLSNRVVSRAELELNHVASCCSDHIGYESILGTAHNDRDDSVGSTHQRRVLSD